MLGLLSLFVFLNFRNQKKINRLANDAHAKEKAELELQSLRAQLNPHFMFNSLNALSEDESLLTMPPWVNPWLLLAMSVSFGLHFVILYVPFLAQVFGIVPLSFNEWLLVLAVALPVILIDEILKFVGRLTNGSQISSRPSKRKTE